MLDATLQKHELVFLEEVATWKLENDRLKKEFSKLARDHVALKQEFGTVTEENDQLKDNQELLMNQRDEFEELKKANAKSAIRVAECERTALDDKTATRRCPPKLARTAA